MTRKRFKKLLMSHGIRRNTVDKYIRINQMTMPSVKVVSGAGWVTPEMREKAEVVLPSLNELIMEIIFSHMP